MFECPFQIRDLASIISVLHLTCFSGSCMPYVPFRSLASSSSDVKHADAAVSPPLTPPPPPTATKGQLHADDLFFGGSESLEDMRLLEDNEFTPSRTTSLASVPSASGPLSSLDATAQIDVSVAPPPHGGFGVERAPRCGTTMFRRPRVAPGSTASGEDGGVVVAPPPDVERQWHVRSNEQLASSRDANITTTPAPSTLTATEEFYGLPPLVKDLYQKRGITSLYDWQHHVLTRDDVHNPTRRRNLVYSLPTSGGKTLVAEVMLMRTVLCRRLSAIFVLPFVSIVEEKVTALQPYGDAFGFGIEGFYGLKGRMPAPLATSIYVCTIEKANSLLNHLFSEKRGSDIGCVVVDELHMVGEGRRGALLELLLTKVTVGCGPRCQIVGMSATVPNMHQLAEWLDAVAYVGTFRPVPLKRHVVCRGVVTVDGMEERRLEVAPNDFEYVARLTLEVAPTDSVLIFCASRQQTVDVARQLAARLPAAAAGSLLHRQRSDLVKELLQLHSHQLEGDLQLLSKAIVQGAAYHHGGLTTEERELVERGYRAKAISVLSCTSTLAAGVNLPARRVVFRSPYLGRDFLTKSQYMQMCGRAGRAGLDTEGSSFLVLSAADRSRGAELDAKALENTLSAIGPQDEMTLDRCLLEACCIGLCATRRDALAFARRLLLRVTRPDACTDTLIMAALDRLIADRFLDERSAPPTLTAAAVPGPREVNVSDSVNGEIKPIGSDAAQEELYERHVVSPTPFGSSAVQSCFTIDEARMMRDELQHMQRHGLVLGDDLHMCYFLTPPKDLGAECDWGVYLSEFQRLSPMRTQIAEALGVNEGYIHQRTMGLIPPISPREQFTTRRFFAALILSDVLSEVPMMSIEQRFCVTRGHVQSLMKNASIFSSSITNFCAAMGWWSLEALFTSFVKRLGYGVKPDLLPLMELQGVQPSRARLLWNAGFRDPKALAVADPEDVLRKVKALAVPTGGGPHASSASAATAQNRGIKFFNIRSAVAIVREAYRCMQSRIREKHGELQELTLPSQPLATGDAAAWRSRPAATATRMATSSMDSMRKRPRQLSFTTGVSSA